MEISFYFLFLILYQNFRYLVGPEGFGFSSVAAVENPRGLTSTAINPAQNPNAHGSLRTVSGNSPAIHPLLRPQNDVVASSDWSPADFLSRQPSESGGNMVEGVNGEASEHRNLCPHRFGEDDADGEDSVLYGKDP